MRKRVHEAMDPAPRALVDAALRDPEAFAEIVNRHKAMVFSLGFNFFRNPAQAEDIAQEVFLELYRNLDRIQSDVHLSFWLRQTATRKCIDQTRRLRHRRYQPLEDVAEPSFEPRPRDPLLAKTLAEKVASLPEKMRMVVILRFQEDLKLGEIAEEMQMPVNTVKTTLRRALARLRDRVRTFEAEVCYGTVRK